MTRRCVFWIASWLALGIGGCATAPPARPDAAKACAEWRWIGISLPETRCPDIPSWTVRPLFPQLRAADCGATESDEVPSPEIIGELNRFCVYEPAHKSKWWGHPPPPPVSAGLARIDQDCAALSLSGEEPPPAAESPEAQSQLLLQQAGVLEHSFPVLNPSGVRLAFLDTEPTRIGAPPEQGNSPHGFALAHIARHIVCDGEPCAAQITTRLALPIIRFNHKNPKLNETDLKRGGFLGLQSDLAQAIWTEVDDWQLARQRTGSRQRLILNLSLAWDGAIFDGLNEAEVTELRTGTQAVYRALQYAQGFHALVLAAAGNQKAAPCDSFGPLLPAAWESGYLHEACGGKSRGTPLLYAVAGVGPDENLIVNARQGGIPPRVAYGDRAVVACPGARGHTAMLTGSSVATAVASSIAAVVWSTYPELEPWEVMTILDKGGKKLPMRADFWFGATTSQPLVSKLTLCTALRQACEDQGRSCQIHVLCPEREALRLGDARPKQPTDFVRDSCQPWTTPQPDKPPCLSCGDPDG